MTNTKPLKILVVRFSSIGDIVLTTPVVRCLHLQTHAEVHFLTKKKYQHVIQNNPYIHQIFGINDHINEVLPQLKAQNYDYIIDLHHNLRTLLLKIKLRKKSYSFDKLNLQKWLLVHLKINLLPATHIVARYLHTTRKLGVVDDHKGLDFYIDDHNVVDINTALPPNFAAGYIAIAIGAQHATKRLPTPKIIDICNKIPLPIVLLGDANDRTNAQIIENTVASSVQIFNACGVLNLQQSASIVQQARHLITHDTGLMHIAAALQVPTTTVWGSTTPKFGMTPYRTPHNIVEVPHLRCRPCSKIGYNACPRQHFNCMQRIDAQSVAALASGVSSP
jgi:ADP-heptose:LPS heptosyltransferase